MRIVVSGMIATYPVGGVLWDYGQYALGFEQMGHEVYYLEDTGLETYNPDKGMYGEDCSFGVGFLNNGLSELSPSLGKRWHFRAMNGKSYGLSQEEIEDIIGDADLFLNVSGSCLLRDAYMRCKRKVMIDTDPGWNHFVNYPKWDRKPGWQGARSYREHEHFFTYAEGIGRSECLLPDMGLDWKKTRPPVVMRCWEPEPPAEKWTTVLTWNNFREPIEHEGKVYGTKEMEFPKVEMLPTEVSASFELAVGGSEAPLKRWRNLGWSIVSSEAISRTLGEYRSYIQSSRGEFSVAKNVYVATRSGWFSCRSVCYLAAGRPVVIQDTGFSANIPSGEGIVVFRSLEEAKNGIEKVEHNYLHHQQAARELARKYFSSDVVLNDLLNQVGL